MNYEQGADYCSYNWHFRILHKKLGKVDPKKVVYSALLAVTDDSLTKNQRTTFVVFVQSVVVVLPLRLHLCSLKLVPTGKFSG